LKTHIIENNIDSKYDINEIVEGGLIIQDYMIEELKEFDEIV
jgi:hypothetical protein